ncbi:M16 family metallopeptidase [Sulfuricystis multivorans]|uniref:M16 family metallopeptidase n=1 Tax=Sulfuricystis multivorans TaxID=2211108 RepID=UPI000F828BDA|nr:pitrilysin family protein [Sulfuricystis multivorans]
MRFLFVFLLVLTSQAIAAPKIEHWTLPNGAKIYFIENHDLPILDVELDFPAGSIRNPPGKAGVASLTVSLIDAGTAEMDEEHISARLVELGARLTTSSDHDKASIVLRTLSSKDEKEGALELMRAVLSAPTFPAAAFERERTRSIAELKEADTQPDAIAAKRFAQALYPAHPYGNVPTPESVATITRDDLVAFHRAHYTAAGAVVSIIGDVTRKEAEAIAVRLTEALPKGDAPPPLPVVRLPERATIEVAHPAEQAHIHIGLPAIRRSASSEYFALLVGNYTLGGGGFVSRLMKEVREKRGYAYSVYSYFEPRLREGPFEIGLQTKREQTQDALKVVDEVLQKFLAEGPTPEELAAAKKHLIQGQALRIDSNAKLLGYLSLIGFYDLPLDYLERFPKMVAAVKREDVKAAFRRHVQPEHLVTVIVAGN